MVHLNAPPSFGHHQNLYGHGSGYMNKYNMHQNMRTPSSAPNLALDTPFCLKHAPKKGDEQGWAERENGTSLPIINVSLQKFGPNMIQIVKVKLRPRFMMRSRLNLIAFQNHGGSVPLATIVHCYEADFEPLAIDKEDGVPMEHLISCIKGLQIQQGVTGSKSIVAVSAADDEV